MNLKKKIISISLLSVMILGGCGQQDSENYYDDHTNNYFETTTEEIKKEYTCAVDLIGEAISDIEASGFDFDLIMDLTEYNLKTAKPYTILIDGTYAFAAAVICKDDAVIANGIETSRSMKEIDENFDIDTLKWSAAFDGNYKSHLLSMKDGRKYDLNYIWQPPYPDKILTVDTSAKSDCAFVYQDSYIYSPDNDFMWFNWGDSIYDVQSSMVDKGFKLRDSTFYSNRIETRSISEKLYGYNFNIYLTYNDNMQFTKGMYGIAADYSELPDIFKSALNDLIAKYGDTINISLSPRFDSIDEQFEYLRNETGMIDPYQFATELYWNVNGHTYITLTLYNTSVHIEYKSIASTSGTKLNENSLI